MLINDKRTDRRAVQQAASLREAGLRVEFVSWRHAADDAESVEGFRIRRIDYAGIAGAIERQLRRGPLAGKRALEAVIGAAADAAVAGEPLPGPPAEDGGAVSRLLGQAAGATGAAYALFRLPPTKLRLRRMAIAAVLPRLAALYGADDVLAVQAHDLDSAWLGLELAKLLGVPLVFDSHEAYTERVGLNGSFRRYYRTVEPRVLREAAFWMTVNPELGKWFVAHYARKGEPVPAPLILENAAPYRAGSQKGTWLRERLGLPAGTRIALYQGGITKHRNVESVVAMARLLDERWAVAILGDGAYAEELARRADPLARGRLHFLKAVPQAELLEVTASADVGLIPYKAIDVNNRYCSPNKLYEFIQAGVPWVANDLPFLGAKTRALGCGWVLDFEDPAAAAALLNGLTAGQLADMRRKVLARRQAESWEEHVKPYVERMRSLARPKA
jgi:glycosyltransferase involved in cell wall biosynthesis